MHNMKVGLSYSRCVKDIFEGKVKYEEVLVLITRTDFHPKNDDHWDNIWRGYTRYNGLMASEWQDYVDKEEEFRSLTIRLYNDGKLHQPRQFGAYPLRTADYWYDLILTEEKHKTNKAAAKAFENYKMITGLI